jgi:putative ABC transport system permease protein
VGAGSIFPLAGNDFILSFDQIGKPPKPPGQSDSAMYYAVTPGYFAVLRIPLKSGRYFNDRDRDRNQQVAIVSETMARQFYPNENPLGQRVKVGMGRAKPAEIVGIVGDVRDDSLEEKGRAAIYQPAAQIPFGAMFFAVRTTGQPESLIAGARAAIRELDSELPLDAVGAVDALVDASLSQRRFAMVLMAAFAGLALLLAMIGIYGVMSYSVAQATQEIGIRLALGAGRADVLGLVLRYGGLMMGIGLAIGIVAGMAASRLLAAQLFEVRPGDPVTYAVVSGALLGTGLAACLGPAWRAIRVDPLVALRSE